MAFPTLFNELFYTLLTRDVVCLRANQHKCKKYFSYFDTNLKLNI